MTDEWSASKYVQYGPETIAVVAHRLPPSATWECQLLGKIITLIHPLVPAEICAKVRDAAFAAYCKGAADGSSSRSD